MSRTRRALETGMTTGQLLLWIVVALLVEVTIAFGLAVWRRRGMQVVPTAPLVAGTGSEIWRRAAPGLASGARRNA